MIVNYPQKVKLIIHFTGRPSRFLFYIFWSIISGLTTNAYSQNLYDIGHSKLYSHYLFETRQFDLAAEELERLLFADPANDSIKFQLVKSYLMGKRFTQASIRMDSLFPDRVTMPGKYALEYAKSLLSIDAENEAKFFIIQNRNLTDQDRLYLKFNSELLSYNWQDALISYEKHKESLLERDTRYSGIISEIASIKYKRPLLALGMSAVIPGLGKAYSKNWKDGLISLVFIGATSLQAIRGYNKYGPGSGFFIAYSSIATTFYLGNLYGSYKSAKKYNDRLKKRIHSSIKAVFMDTL